MRGLRVLPGLWLLGCAAVQGAFAQGAVPAGVILVKGPWSSASDSLISVPEGGRVVDNEYRNDYFALSFGLSPNWTQRYEGPPPSDSGYYVLAQIEPLTLSQATGQGHILIAAQDMFFTLSPAKNALELINYNRANLAVDYKVESAPTPVRIAGHVFVRFDYAAPLAGLHWHVLATDIRCHTVQFILTDRSAGSIERLAKQMSQMHLPHAATAPVCIKDYASAENVIQREDPVFSEPRFNPVPVRIVIDEQGRVKHIHFLRAFPDQVKGISDALRQWRFKPYLAEGRPVEVETGIIFGRAPRASAAILH